MRRRDSLQCRNIVLIVASGSSEWRWLRFWLAYFEDDAMWFLLRRKNGNTRLLGEFDDSHHHRQTEILFNAMLYINVMCQKRRGYTVERITCARVLFVNCNQNYNHILVFLWNKTCVSKNMQYNQIYKICLEMSGLLSRIHVAAPLNESHKFIIDITYIN